jgi:hypothetical protein
MTLIAVVNQSTEVNNTEVQLMCQAQQIQFDLHCAPAWRKQSPTVAFYADKTKVPGYAWIINILDNSTQAGALGYHDDSATGTVEAFVFAEPVLTNAGVVLYDPTNTQNVSVSSVFSHECMEAFVDPYANGFSLGPQISQGNLYAQEAADPVQGDSYAINVGGTNVSMSNFIFPSWLNPSATSVLNMPFDYLKKLTAPFTMDAGGYMIVATMSNEGQLTSRSVFGEKVPEWRKNYVKSFYRRQA